MSQSKYNIDKIPYLIYYHTVSDRQAPHLKYLIPMKSSKELEADLDYLGKFFEFISLAQFQNLLKTGQQSGKRKIVLTFDDGYSEVSDIVQPILLRKGIPAAIFLTSDFLDNQDLYYRCKVSIIKDVVFNNFPSPAVLQKLSQTFQNTVQSKYDIIHLLDSWRYNEIPLINSCAEIIGVDFQLYLSQQKPYLSQHQVKTLLANGFEIGAHSMDHPFYGKISLTEQLKQTMESMNRIQDTFHLPYRYFALPHSDSGICPEYYYHARKAVDLILGGYGVESYPHYQYYQRFSIERYHMYPYLAWKLETAIAYSKRHFYPSPSHLYD